MKKLFSFALCVAILLSVGLAFAEYASTDCFDDKYSIANNATTQLTTTIPSSIIAGDKTYRLLSISVGMNARSPSSGEMYVALYDAVGPSGLGVIGNMEIEIENNNYSPFTKYTWIKPLKIYNGVVIVQGGQSIVTIEYERVR